MLPMIGDARRVDLKAGVSALALGLSLLMTGGASAQQKPEGMWNAPGIIPRNDLSPNQPPPGGVLDLGVTGIGQVITDAGGGFIGTCTGTLVNPRMVIFAAHCVNDIPATQYGANSGGTGIGVFFNDFTLLGIRQWLGIDPGAGAFKSNPNQNYFNVNQVWYDPRSLALGPDLNFLEADVAIATLDAHAGDIPTWALLFSPLRDQTHAQLIGYGSTGDAVNPTVSGGFRRRAVENILSLLGSLDDVDRVLFGPQPDILPQSLYQTDFDDPRFGTPQANEFDFDIFDGRALPREGTTGPGDSGGPLIVDRLFSRKVVAGVLSGGSRYFNDQPFSTYGTTNFYQPLFLFWDKIVERNPYVYASAKRGDGDWFDPTHWVQDLDPNYTVIRNGRLVNGLPTTPAQGVTGDTVKFGDICFFDDCVSIDRAGPSDPGGGPIVIPGGPGSTNFVPDNKGPDRRRGTVARYYDVTLDQAGTTSLQRGATIDRLTIDRSAKLDIRNAGGALRVLGDFTQMGGWTNIDGSLTTGEALLVEGLLSGRGRFRAPFVTLGAVGVLPGGLGEVNTLTVEGNLVFSSATVLFTDVRRNRFDQVRVRAADGAEGFASLAGSIVFSRGTGAAPRDGDSFAVVTAEGGIDGEFENVVSLTGVLRPELDYQDNAVVATLKAGSFSAMLPDATPTQAAFAKALDQLRGSSYANLSSLYGETDWLDGKSLAGLFDNLAPTGFQNALSLFEGQSDAMTDLFSGRLAALGSDDAPAGLSMIGDVGQVLAYRGNASAAVAATSFGFGGMQGGAPVQFATLPQGTSGFVAGGYTQERVSSGTGRSALSSTQGGQGWHLAAGLERKVDQRLTLGFATAYAGGDSLYGEGANTLAETRTMMAAAYGAYKLGGGAYVAAMASAGTADADSRRQFGAGLQGYDLDGDISGTTLSGLVETGVNWQVAEGLTLTPKVGLRYGQLSTDAYEERGGDAALRVDARTLRRTEGRVGAAFTGSFDSAEGDWSFTPRLEANFVRNLSGDDPAIRARFALAGAESFALPALARDSGWAEIRGGARLSVGGVTYGFDVSSDVARSDLHEDRVRLSVGMKF